MGVLKEVEKEMAGILSFAHSERRPLNEAEQSRLESLGDKFHLLNKRAISFKRKRRLIKRKRRAIAEFLKSKEESLRENSLLQSFGISQNMVLLLGRRKAIIFHMRRNMRKTVKEISGILHISSSAVSRNHAEAVELLDLLKIKSEEDFKSLK